MTPSGRAPAGPPQPRRRGTAPWGERPWSGDPAGVAVSSALAKSRWMEGSATLTMVKSSTTMNCAIDNDSSNANPWLGRRS